MLPERTLQYMYDLKIAGELTGVDMLNGEGKRALDVGCGIGYGLLALKVLGYKVYGFDLNKYHVEKCKAIGFRNVMVANLEEKIPYNEAFDLVVCFDVLEHVRHLSKALRNLLSINFKVLVITIPNLYTEFLRLTYLILRHKIRPSIYRGKGLLLKDPDHVNMHSPKLWLNLISRFLQELHINAEIKHTTYIQLCISDRCVYRKLPYIGSSIMIALIKEFW